MKLLGKIYLIVNYRFYTFGYKLGKMTFTNQLLPVLELTRILKSICDYCDLITSNLWVLALNYLIALYNSR